MPSVEIHALGELDAIHLATRLLDEEQVQLLDDQSEAILQHLVTLTDCVPFYIENVCSRLGELEGYISVENVETGHLLGKLCEYRSFFLQQANE